MLAERQLDAAYFNQWRDRLFEASVAMDNREERMDALYEEIEYELQLIGVTAIEDKLQDGVAQTIQNLQLAGIKIWVLTGDKQGIFSVFIIQYSTHVFVNGWHCIFSCHLHFIETAINIGYSCQLLTDDLVDVFVVDGETMSEVEKQLRKFKESIKIINTFHPPCKLIIIKLDL